MNEDESGLLIFASESGDFQQLLESNHEIETHPFSWSPDGEWLLFSQTQSEESGLYLIHRQGGEPYLLLDTTGTVLPYFVNWLPNNTFAP
jgi:Tol biopolymer transport system component